LVTTTFLHSFIFRPFLIFLFPFFIFRPSCQQLSSFVCTLVLPFSLFSCRLPLVVNTILPSFLPSSSFLHLPSFLPSSFLHLPSFLPSLVCEGGGDSNSDSSEMIVAVMMAAMREVVAAVVVTMDYPPPFSPTVTTKRQ
jgi:hypothetical protein